MRRIGLRIDYQNQGLHRRKVGRPGAGDRKVGAYVVEKAVGLEQEIERLGPTLLKRQ